MAEANKCGPALAFDIVGGLVVAFAALVLFRVPPFVSVVEVERPYLDNMTRDRLWSLEMRLKALVELLYSFDERASEEAARTQELVDSLRTRLDDIYRKEPHKAKPREETGDHPVADDHAQ